MKTLIKTTLSLAVISSLFPAIANAAGNAQNVNFSKSAAPIEINVVDGKVHTVDFSHAEIPVSGVIPEDPAELQRSFNIQAVPNQAGTVTIVGVKGGSSRLLVTIVRTDEQGRNYFQPIKLVKKWTPYTLTQISDTNISAEQKSNNAEVVALERGYQVVSQNPNLAPDLRERMGELVEAVKNNEDIDQAAEEIVVSEPVVQQLITIGSTTPVQPKYTDRRLAL